MFIIKTGACSFFVSYSKTEVHVYFATWHKPENMACSTFINYDDMTGSVRIITSYVKTGVKTGAKTGVKDWRCG